MKKKKRLKRDEEKAVVAGVLSGMAHYFDQDPALFRVMAIVFLILTGIFPGILIYIAAWVVMPGNGRGRGGGNNDNQRVDYEVVE